MTVYDFSHPQRMSPGAFFIIFTKLFMKSIAPLSIAGVYNIIAYSSDDLWKFILFISAVCVTVPLVWALISYLPKKFYIKDGNLVFIHGILDHESTVVPLDRVHSLRTEKGIWFRLLDMRGIIFDTLATRQEEIELILDEYEWKRLLAVIDKDGKTNEDSVCCTAWSCGGRYSRWLDLFRSLCMVIIAPHISCCIVSKRPVRDASQQDRA